MTYDEKLASLKLDRSTAINSKINMVKARDEALDDDNFCNKFLWGEGSFIGVMQLIKLYYEEKNLERGRTYSSPTIGGYTKANWDDRLDDDNNHALSIYGDGANGFYPPDANGVAAQNMNLNTPWLNDNDENAETAGGLMPLFPSLDSAIGENASDNSDGRADGPYGSQPAAQTAGEARRDADKGTTLRGKRTDNNEVTTNETPPTSGNWYYNVGSGGIDTPDYYSDPEMANLLTAISNIINDIDDSSDYQVKLTEIYDEVDNIETGVNELFSAPDAPDMKDDVDDDRTVINTLKTNLDNWVGDSGDNSPFVSTDVPTTLWGFYNWFNLYPGGFITEFNARLDDLDALTGGVSSTIPTAIIARFGTINGIVGANYAGDPEDFTKLKKWRFFWIGTRILKPKASLIMYLAMKKAVNRSGNAIDNANYQLDILLGTSNREEYIPTPTLFAAFEDPKRDDDGALTQRRLGIAYDGQQHASEYKIYRKTMSSTALDNAQWGIVAHYTFSTKKQPENEFVKNVYLDLDSGFAQGQSYVYRVRTRDKVNDSFNAGSVESDIYDEDTEYTFNSIVNGALTINESDHEIKTGQYIVIKDTSSSDGFYLVTKINEQKIFVSPTITLETGGKLYPCGSIVFILE